MLYAYLSAFMVGHVPQLSVFHASFRPLAVKPGRQQQQQQTYIQINPRLKALTHSHLAWAVLDKSSITTPNTSTTAATTTIPGSTAPSSTSHTPSTSNTLGLEFNMTSMQAWAASSLLFDHLLRCQRQQQRSHSFPFHLGQAAGPPQLSCSPMASVAELRHPQARALLQLLARVWVAHAPAEKDLAEQLRQGGGGSGMNDGTAAGSSDGSSNSGSGFTASIGRAFGNSAGQGGSMGEGSFWKPGAPQAQCEAPGTAVRLMRCCFTAEFCAQHRLLQQLHAVKPGGNQGCTHDLLLLHS